MKSYISKLAVEELPEDTPSLVVVALDAGATPKERYLRYTNAKQPLPSGKPIAAIVRSVPLSTPDEIRVTETSQDGQTFRIALETRCYQGQLFANVVMTALVQVELGSLASGDYDVMVAETTLHFQELQHPENATNPTTKSHHLRFSVR